MRKGWSWGFLDGEMNIWHLEGSLWLLDRRWCFGEQGKFTKPVAQLFPSIYPRPCGFYSDTTKECTCSMQTITRYQVFSLLKPHLWPHAGSQSTAIICASLMRHGANTKNWANPAWANLPNWSELASNPPEHATGNDLLNHQLLNHPSANHPMAWPATLTWPAQPSSVRHTWPVLWGCRLDLSDRVGRGQRSKKTVNGWVFPGHPVTCIHYLYQNQRLLSAWIWGEISRSWRIHMTWKPMQKLLLWEDFGVIKNRRLYLLLISWWHRN